MPQEAERAGESETGSKCEQSFLTKIGSAAALVSQEKCGGEAFSVS